MSRVADDHPVRMAEVDAVVHVIALAMALAATFIRIVSAVSPVTGSVADAA